MGRKKNAGRLPAKELGTGKIFIDLPALAGGSDSLTDSCMLAHTCCDHNVGITAKYIPVRKCLLKKLRAARIRHRLRSRRS